MNEGNDSIRIGVIGCGDIAATRHIPTIATYPGTYLAALCDSDIRRAEQLAATYQVPQVTTDYKQLLQNDELDAIVVATPPWVTPHITMDCLRAGKHVLCEKPMAVDVETAMKVRETELESGKKVQVGFTYRHGPLLETLRRWICEGRLGSPLVYRMGIFDEVWDPSGNPGHYERIYQTMQHGSPSLHDGAHVADFLHYLTDSQVKNVESYGFKTREEFPSTNYDTSIIWFENGDIAKVEIGWFFPKFPKGEFEVLGPLGIAEFDRFEQYVRLKTNSVTETVSLEEDWALSCFKEQLHKFIESIRSDHPCVPGSIDRQSSFN